MTKANNGKISAEGLELPSACDPLSVVKSIWPEGRIEQ